MVNVFTLFECFPTHLTIIDLKPRLFLNKVIAKVVTGTLRKIVNMSVISVISIILLKVSSQTALDMDVINVNTKQHARVILININSQIMTELNMNVTSVNTNLHDSHIKSKHEGVRY